MSSPSKSITEEINASSNEINQELATNHEVDENLANENVNENNDNPWELDL